MKCWCVLLILVRAFAIITPGEIAIMTKDAKDFRESIVNYPTDHVATVSNFLSVFFALAIFMIDSKKSIMFVAATCTFTTIVIYH